MKCPKCGYHSFEHLDNCKKCGQGLSDHKEKFNLCGFAASRESTPATTAPAADQANIDTFDTTDKESVDFGFDFLEEEDPVSPPSASVSLDSDNQDISLDQPFSVDSETIPDVAIPEDRKKSDKGPEFIF